MKIALALILVILSVNLFAQDKLPTVPQKCCESKVKVDSMYTNYYVYNYTDTVYFTKNAGVVKCRDLASMKRGHNHCRLWSFENPVNGNYFFHVQSGTITFDLGGLFKDGYIENATETIYYNEKVYVTGQYQQNAKMGLWTLYRTNGTLESIHKFIPELDDAVVVWEYDESGKLVNYVNEEKEMREILNGKKE